MRDQPTLETYHDSAQFQSLVGVQLGEGVRLGKFLNLYGCVIGSETKIGAFVEIQKGAVIGRRCKISSHTFVCEGVTIGDGVFVGHNVTFINDKWPAATTFQGRLEEEGDWKVIPTEVCDRAAIGSGATILCGVRIGVGALVGAGAVVTKDVPDGDVVVGNPATSLTDKTFRLSTLEDETKRLRKELEAMTIR